MASDHPLMKNSEAARLLSRPWWNLCFVHGDQTKYYRQLYGKRRPIRTLMQHSDDNNPADNSATVNSSSENKCANCNPNGTLSRKPQ